MPISLVSLPACIQMMISLGIFFFKFFDGCLPSETMAKVHGRVLTDWSLFLGSNFGYFVKWSWGGETFTSLLH